MNTWTVKMRTVKGRAAFLTAAILIVPGATMRSSDPAAAPAAPAPTTAPATPPVPAGGQAPQAEAALRAIVADYVGLYQAGTLDRWKRLFHPALTVADPRPDGTIRVRGLEEFFAAQKAGFAAGRIDGERLENVRIEGGRKIARVTADFIFSGEGTEGRGRLGLHLAEEAGGWKIVAIVYSYDQP